MAIEVSVGKYDQGMIDSCSHLIRILEGAPNKSEYGAARFFVNNLEHICKLMPHSKQREYTSFRAGMEEAHKWTLEKVTEIILKFGYTSGGPDDQAHP